MKTKLVFLALLGLVSGLIVVGCSNDNTATPTDTTKSTNAVPAPAMTTTNK